MARNQLKHIDKGIIYIPIDSDATQDYMDEVIEKNAANGHTIVFLRSGRYNIKNTIKELIKTTINS